MHTGQDIVMRADTMNAETTSQHLCQILDAVPDVPLVVFLDRAPWHRGQPIRDVLAAHPRLELVYLPVATPDLNPQEHVWKQTRDAVGHLRDYPHLSNLRQAFQSYLENTLFQFDWIDKYLPTFYVSEFI